MRGREETKTEGRGKSKGKSKGKGKRMWDEGPGAEGQQAEGLQGSLVEGNHFIDEGYHEFSESKP